MMRVIIDMEGVGAIEFDPPDGSDTVLVYCSTNHNDLRAEIDPRNADDFRRFCCAILGACELVDPKGYEVVRSADLAAPLKVSPEDIIERARRLT